MFYELFRSLGIRDKLEAKTQPNENLWKATELDVWQKYT